jgi:hypothetical protein
MHWLSYNEQACPNKEIDPAKKMSIELRLRNSQARDQLASLILSASHANIQPSLLVKNFMIQIKCISVSLTKRGSQLLSTFLGNLFNVSRLRLQIGLILYLCWVREAIAWAGRIVKEKNFVPRFYMGVDHDSCTQSIREWLRSVVGVVRTHKLICYGNWQWMPVANEISNDC